MSSTYGERFRFTIFGQSHSPAIGVTMEGIPAGFAIDMDKLQTLEDMKTQLSVVLAKGRCKNITKEEVYTLVDEIFEQYK